MTCTLSFPDTEEVTDSIIGIAHARNSGFGASHLASLDIHTGQVFGSCPPIGIAPFMELSGQVMAQPKYKDAPQVFVIVDNGSDHRSQTAIKRLGDAS